MPDGSCAGAVTSSAEPAEQHIHIILHGYQVEDAKLFIKCEKESSAAHHCAYTEFVGVLIRKYCNNAMESSSWPTTHYTVRLCEDTAG
jgi:hypothetical protein